MKQKYFCLSFLLLVFVCCHITILPAQNQNSSWTVNTEYHKVFIENQGQFPFMLNSKISKEGVLYGVDHGSTKIYFTKKGLTYHIIQSKGKKKKESVSENPENIKAEWAEGEKKPEQREYKQDNISIIWENSNPDVEIIAENSCSEYFSYSFFENGEERDVNNIKGYNKITYKNLYPNIDVEYTFHPSEGIKYALILHPGADVSLVKMTYSGLVSQSENGDIHIKTAFGDIIDHAPTTYYTDNTGKTIKSKFVLTGNTVAFSLGKYDNTKSVTVDPWVVSPNFNSSTAVWEVETDAVGNVYVIGGEMPMQLRKFDINGNPGWTYSTPWDTSNVWLGTLATDNLGNSYITSGTTPEIKKVNNAGSVVWSNSGYNSTCEYWSITFNCDKTKLIVGGTYVPSPLSFDYSSAIYNININNGSVINFVTFDTVNIGGFGTTPIEVRSISSSKNAKYIFLTHNNVGAINQNIGACPGSAPIFELDNGHHLSYKCENYLPSTQNGGGLKALVANDQFFYTHSGNQIHKRSLSNGALIASATIPGGANQTVLGKIVVSNSGLAVDNCGNVYAGSTDRVVKFDANLNIISQTTVPFCVYDVSVNSNGEVIAVGAQNNNQAINRNGEIQSINMSACAQYALLCCDASVCPVAPVCSTDPAFNLTPTTTGGSWSGPGITNTSLGTFNPSVAGPGTHTIIYTLACGIDSVIITVNACANLVICIETNGNLTVSGGSPTYTWQTGTSYTDCSGCPFGNCIPVICPGVYTTTWTTFGTGTTVTPPIGADTVRVTDGSSNTTTIYTLSTLPTCTPCPTITATPTNIVNTCAGSSNGSFSIAATNGTSPYDYTLMNGATTVATYLNVAGTQNFTSLPAGTYTLNINDNNNCTASVSITIASNPAPTANAGPDQTICSGNTATLTATGGATYSWNTGATTSTISVNPSATSTYTVTVYSANGCSASDNVVVTVTAALVANAGPDQSICLGNSAVLNASGGSTYQWNTGATTSTITVNPTTTTTYTVTVSSGTCTPATDAVTVVVNPNPVISISPSSATLCSGSSQTLVASGAATFTWSPALGLSSTTGATVTANPTTTTTYTVVGSLSGTGCSSSSSVVITVLPGVTANAGNDVNICNGDTTLLTASGGTLYTWSPATGLSSTNGATVMAYPNTTTTYIVTVSDGSCSNTDNITVTVNNIPIANINGDTIICAGSPVILTASTALSYSWSNSDTTQSITVQPVTPTTYTVTVSNAGCSSTADITIQPMTPPMANAGNDTTIAIGGSAQLSGTGGIIQSWNPVTALSCINCPNPTANPLSTTTYVLMVTDAQGCVDYDTVTVYVDIECGEVFVPNAFSPNEDGENEFECVYGNCIQTINFAIYDRWGEKVFETQNPKECWDGKYKGKPMNTGVFVFYLKAKLYDGTEISKQGNINLFR